MGASLGSVLGVVLAAVAAGSRWALTRTLLAAGTELATTKNTNKETIEYMYMYWVFMKQKRHNFKINWSLTKM